MQNSELCLPTKAIAKDGVPPATGETVEIQSLKGTVTRTEGDNTYFRPTEINGQPVATSDENNEGEPPAEDGMPTEASLRARALEEDEEA